jgi:hypothetical protein
MDFGKFYKTKEWNVLKIKGIQGYGRSSYTYDIKWNVLDPTMGGIYVWII